jgi:pilus assembly protein CpaC
VINGLTIRGKDQVMLKVTVAEVQRQVLKELGVNLSAANWTVGNTAVDFFTETTAAFAARNAVGATHTPNGPGGDRTRASCGRSNATAS